MSVPAQTIADPAPFVRCPKCQALHHDGDHACPKDAPVPVTVTVACPKCGEIFTAAATAKVGA